MDQSYLPTETTQFYPEPKTMICFPLLLVNIVFMSFPEHSTIISVHTKLESFDHFHSKQTIIM